MMSTIIYGATLSERAESLRLLVTNKTNLIHLAPNPTSIGIADIKTLVANLAISSPIERIVWIEEAQKMTFDASGALLKTLEEPPFKTTIYLTCPNHTALLPTIISRCKLKRLNQQQTDPGNEQLALIKPFFAFTPGDRIQHLSDFPSDKIELLEFFSQLSCEISETIKKTTNQNGLNLLAKLGSLTLAAHQDLKNNVNQTLTLTHYLLHLPKTK